MLNLLFYLFLCINFFFWADCSTPVERLCANAACTEPISQARGTVPYIADAANRLSFKRGKEITIISKTKNEKDYWGAIIDGHSGYVPSDLIKETKLYYPTDKLLVVSTDASSDIFNDSSVEQTIEKSSDLLNSDKVPPQNNKESDSVVLLNSKSETLHHDLSQETLKTIEKDSTDNGLSENSDPNLKVLSNLSPTKSYDVIEGTTVFIDAIDEITPSPTAEVELNTQTVAPFVQDANLNQENILPEKGVKNSNEIHNVNDNNKILSNQDNILDTESVKSNDLASEVDIDNDGDESESDDDDDGDDDDDDEEDDVDVDVDVDNDEKYVLGDKIEDSVNLVNNDRLNEHQHIEKNDMNISEHVNKSSAISEENSLEKNATAENVLSQNSTNTENSDLKVDEINLTFKNEMKENHNQSFIVVNSVENSAPTEVNSNIEANTKQKNSKDDAGDINVHQHDGNSEVFLSLSKTLESEQFDKVQNEFDKKEVEWNALNDPNPTESSHDFTGSMAKDTKAILSDQLKQILSDSGKVSNSLSDTGESVTSNKEKNNEISEMEASEIISNESTQMNSISSDSTQMNSISSESTQMNSISNEMEGTTEAVSESQLQYSTSFAETAEVLSDQSANVVEKNSEIIEELNPTPADINNVDAILDKVNVDATLDNVGQIEQSAEAISFFSQMTELVTNWFSSDSNKEDNNNGDFNENADQSKIEWVNEKPEIDIITNPNIENSGADDNVEQKSIHEDIASEQQIFYWNYWLPDYLHGSSNTFLYLVVTAVTVLLFTLGHNFIEKKGKSGPLIAKINKLEQELFVTSKECLLLKDELSNAKDRITLYENSSNDELIVSLQAELEESKKVKSELESSIEILQQELDAATEAGLDLNKMLSEVLTQKGGSESLLESVENLQAQLNRQQKIIDEMTKKLGDKNEENEALQTALEAANQKAEILEEQLGDAKSNLDLSLKENETIAQDLKSQISKLQVRINQLNRSKEKEMSKVKRNVEELQSRLTETSNALSLKEEECKSITMSIKQIEQTKGNVNFEAMFDVCKVKADLAKIEKDNKILSEELNKEKDAKKASEDQVKHLSDEVEKLKISFEEAKQKEIEAQKKLEVLSTYFKEKETQLQKELGLQEALWSQKKGDEKAVYNMMKSLQEEVDSYKSQNETLKKEILDQERGLKNQMASLEQKAHENWVAARQAERKLEESKQETAQLRNRLTLMEKNSNSDVEGKANHRGEELNGVEATSPVDTSSPLLFSLLPLDPNASTGLPHGFMPHPMFMPPPMGGFIPPPPFLPGDRRPPPLGRMSSPPLNSPFSPPPPPDYSYKRMSPPPPPPPLSPRSRSYRSQNEADREHFRHKSPRDWDEGQEMPGFIPISGQRSDSKREHKGSKVSSGHSSSDSLDQSSKHSLRVANFIERDWEKHEMPTAIECVVPKNMAVFMDINPNVFPLQDISSVVKVFKIQLTSVKEPNLALLSIVAGAVENSLTCNRNFTVEKETEFDEGKLPAVEYHIVKALYMKFCAVIKGAVDVTLYGDGKYATRDLVKRVSDVIWNSLTRSYYKDRAHLQSLFSYLTGNKLDCFGVAFAVVAGCQVLGYNDVHLALSEDHAWVVFGEKGEETAEVTWHGKGSEDKRGQPIAAGVGSRSWLYVNGCPVICTRPMEVAALVSSINPSLNATSDAIEVALLQQELLWLLYDLKQLAKYPMALGNLGDLEEISPTPERQLCSVLFEEAILSAQTFYQNQHVYPYTYQAGFFYRHNMYKEAFESWANAADVIRQYNYSRDDEEIYKEFMEIANELIPHIIKVVSSGHSAKSILKDSECFAHLLRFYDGICQWEEGSQTPVLHIGWAKPLVHTISKFDAEVRAQVVIEQSNPADENFNTKDIKKVPPSGETRGDGQLNNNVEACKTRELIRNLESEVSRKEAAADEDDDDDDDEADADAAGLNPKILALTAACSEKILNPKYLLQGGDEPFVKGVLTESNSIFFRDGENQSSDVTDGPEASTSRESGEAAALGREAFPQPKIVLHSQKMIGLKDLLLAEKLNTHAISLQLTAQSQVQISKKGRGLEPEPVGRPKRTRRE